MTEKEKILEEYSKYILQEMAVTKQKLIEDLKKTSKGNEQMQAKFQNYEAEVARLQAENEQLKIDNELKVELLAEKAKAEDLDYLMFKIKQEHTELSLDEQGKIKGVNVADVKQVYPNNFETASTKKVDVQDLPSINDQEGTVTKEQFDKMSYKEKNELFNTDPETYKNLSK